jgi:hypothetical protein
MDKPAQQVETKIDGKKDPDKRSSLEDKWRNFPVLFAERCYSVVIPRSCHEANYEAGEREYLSKKTFDITSQPEKKKKTQQDDIEDVHR